MKLRMEVYSYRFAEQIINSRLELKNEINDILLSLNRFDNLSRPNFNKILKSKFQKQGWDSQPQVFTKDNNFCSRLDFQKSRVGMEVQFGHSSFIGIDLLKFQVASYSNLDTIDFGVYIVTTKNFQKVMKNNFSLKWDGSLSFEKVIKYLPEFKSAIQVPIYVIGVDIY